MEVKIATFSFFPSLLYGIKYAKVGIIIASTNNRIITDDTILLLFLLLKIIDKIKTI